jgi:DNA adenine methylase
MFYSPLRYPGGKQKLAKFIGQICVDSNTKGHYVEPYAGGASVALYLLLEKKVEHITINDYDRSLYAFWWTVLNRTKQLCELIESTPITVEVWKEMKMIQAKKDKASLLMLGFSTLFLNRTNRSGILNGGIIGGYEQKGGYKIDCRFNKSEIIQRIKTIAAHKKHITLTNLDALVLIDEICRTSNNRDTVFYFDPPYYLKGPGLYLNSYKHNDHLSVSKKIQSISKIKWIVSYDNHPAIREMYNWVLKDKTIDFSIQHSAYQNRKGKEVVFLSETISVANVELLNNL